MTTPPTPDPTPLVALARRASRPPGSADAFDGPAASGLRVAAALSDAADARTRELIERFVHRSGPAPGRFAWLALGSHARRELHCASDQDHALIWDSDRAAASSYAAELAATVIAGLAELGMRPCDGGYMADRWSTSLEDWVAAARERIEAPTPQAVLDTDIFLDLRTVAGDLDTTAASEVLLLGAESPRLLHGLATAANSFTPPRGVVRRLRPRRLDVKRSGLAPIVLLARLYGLRAHSTEVGTIDRLQAAGAAGVLSEELTGRLSEAFELLTLVRLRTQLAQVDSGLALSDKVHVDTLPAADQRGLREALRTVRAAQSVTSVAFRTDL
jgi:CBS domain-containing protein